jgi:hypothetical protein
LHAVYGLAVIQFAWIGFYVWVFDLPDRFWSRTIEFAPLALAFTGYALYARDAKRLLVFLGLIALSLMAFLLDL